MQTPQTISFDCEKKPATGSRGMVVSNHPLASSAGATVLLEGGNAIDACVATLFALTVVEPMMVGLLGGGIAHIRLESGRHIIIDGLSTAPSRASETMYQTVSDVLPNYRDTVGRKNLVGPLSVAVPGALAGWCHALEQYGTWALGDVLAPAIRLAEDGFLTTPYLSDCIADFEADLSNDKGLASLFLPNGGALPAGERLVQTDYGQTLRSIASSGSGALYGGALGDLLVNEIARLEGLIGPDDLNNYAVVEREPIRGVYRGYEVIGPPPPASAGVHIVQMLNLLEGFDIASMGYGSSDSVHLLAEVLKIAFADRSVATADPAFVDVPVEQLIDKAYAEERRQLIDMSRAMQWSPGVGVSDSHSTTHVTVADALGNVVASTQTINGLFGACLQIPETGLLANNYMFNFDPHPHTALSVQPGKRVFTSMAPMMVCQEQQMKVALGLPGGMRIFPSAFQTLVNLLDHGMTLQEAVEAPRIWTEGGTLEMENTFSAALEKSLVSRGHDVTRLQRIAGGMNAIGFSDDGVLTGAACWRADGTPVGISGGLARQGVRFSGL
ncbi:MAG: gamma-glutamyltransferase [Arenicellales bacterium]|jgi:gamma-glutamyltranspeptidase/glutathione hydrolase|nr:gamma-glutamyltransferase [Arenicellales bacterium]